MRTFSFKYPKLIASMALVLSTATTAQEQSDSQKKDDIEVIQVSSKGLISYVSASASKSNVPITKTPVSVSVLTSQRISDLGAETLQDAIGYVAGVYNGPYGVDTRGDWASVRGVAPAQYQDGLQLMFGNYNNVRPNPYNFESVEILKGPSSVLYGQGSTGGIINAVSKRPHSERSGEVWAQLGNYDRQQIAIDLNSPLTSDQSVQGRVVALYRDSGTQTEYVDDNSIFIAPSLKWQINDDNSLLLLANLQKNKSGSSTQFFPHVGTIKDAPNGAIPSERFVSEPDWDRYDTEQASVTAIYEHNFDLDTTLILSARYSDSNSDYRTMYAWPPRFEADNRSIKRLASLSEGMARVFVSDLQLHKAFDFANTENQFVIGIDYQDVDTETDRLTDRSVNAILDLYDPVYGQVDNLPQKIDDSTSGANTSNTKQIGLYAQNTLEYGNFALNTALRYDEVESGAKYNTTDSDNDYVTTGRIGLIYQFENGLSPYTSYSESFKTLSGEKIQGGRFKPQEGKQVEVGIKYQPQGTEHLITAALFDIKENNQIRTISPFEQAQDGETHIQGFELEAQLEWQNFDVYASYAYTDSKQDTTPDSLEDVLTGIMTMQGQIASGALPPSDAAALGRLVRNHQNMMITDEAALAATPKHLASVWVTYRADQLLEGLKFGMGLRHVGETYDGSRTVEAMGQTLHQSLTTSSYELVDMMIGYSFDKFDLSLNIDNVSDKTVINSCLYRGDCFYGQRRTVTANIKYRF